MCRERQLLLLFQTEHDDKECSYKYFSCPVEAMPIMSLPDRTVGIPWNWVGVRQRMPFLFRPHRMATGNFISLKLLMGGGTASPATMVWYFFCMCSCCSSDMLRE